LQNFEPAYSKMGFVKMLFEDDCGHLNFDNLNRVMKKIKTT